MTDHNPVPRIEKESERTHKSGSIPPDQRRLVVIVLIVVGLAVAGGSLLVSLVADFPVNWFWLPVGSLTVMLLIGIYLWVRLSD